MKSTRANFTCDRCGQAMSLPDAALHPAKWSQIERRLNEAYGTEHVADLCVRCTDAVVDFIERGAPEKANPRVEQAPANGPYR